MGDLLAREVAKQGILKGLVTGLPAVAIFSSRFANGYRVAFRTKLAEVLIPYRRHVGGEISGIEEGLSVHIGSIDVR